MEGTLKAGDIVLFGKVQVIVPQWLKVALPRRSAPVSAKQSLVDLSLPLLDLNPFHRSMRNHMEESGLLKSLRDGTDWCYTRHVLVLGCSGN